jgi:hypothetical protein
MLTYNFGRPRRPTVLVKIKLAYSMKSVTITGGKETLV